ncbi:MAG: DUF2334 domain-containing protein [Bacteroidia bacterium]
MKLFIRDDDTSYFTNPKELETAYNGIWEKGPISIAVVPFDVKTVGRGNVLTYKQDPSVEYPIGKNEYLVDTIKQLIKENKLYIMLHGYNHFYKPIVSAKYPFGIPEFEYRTNTIDYLKKGKDYLEDIFHQEIKWFVPPSNAMNTEAIESCDKLNLNIATSIGIKKRKVNYHSLRNYFAIKYAQLRRVNYAFDYGNHYELSTISFTKVADYKKIKQEHPLDNFIIATHYWEINENTFVKDALNHYVDQVNKIFSVNEIVR